MEVMNLISKILTKHGKVLLVNVDINNNLCHHLMYEMSSEYIISGANPLDLIDGKIIFNDVDGTYIECTYNIFGESTSSKDFPVLSFNKVDNHYVGNIFIINTTLTNVTGVHKISDSEFYEKSKLAKQISYVDGVLKFK